MAIDKKIFDTLEVGSQNQILSAAKQYGTSSQQVTDLYNSFLPQTPTPPVVNTMPPSQTVTEVPKIQTQTSTSVPDNSITPPPVIPKVETPKIQTPTQTTTTEKITTPTGETTKVTTPITPVDKNVRSQEILNNLNEGYKNDLTIKNAIDTGNFEAFKAKYNMSNPEEAKIIEAYFQAHQPKDEGGLFNILKTGQKIYNPATENSNQMSKAKARYDIYNKYQGMGADQLYNAYINGEIGSQLEQDLVTNPNLAKAKEKYQKKIEIDQINNDAKNVLNVYNKSNGKVTTPQNENTLETLSEKMLKIMSDTGKSDIPAFKDYMATNYPDIVTKSTELNSKAKLIKEKADERDARLENIIKENPGISINRATMLASRQNKDLNNEIKTLSYEIGNLQADVQFQTNLADKSYGYDLQAQSRQDALNAEKRGYAMDILKTQESRIYEEEQKAKELKNKFDYTYGDLTSTNPQIQKIAAIRMAEAIQKQYEGMPFRRSVDVMADDIVKQINSGMTTDQITNEITNAIQNAPDYENWKANNQKLSAPAPAKPETQMIGSDLYEYKNGNWTKAITGEPKSTNPKWEQDKQGNWYNANSPESPALQISSTPPAGTTDAEGYKKATTAKVGDTYGSCGLFANDYTGVGSEPGGDDTIAGRTKTYKDKTGVSGGLVFFTGGGYDKKNGHVAVIDSINPDGTLNIRESNYNGNNKVGIRTNVPTTYVKGYYNNTPLAKVQTKTTETGYSDKEIPSYIAYKEQNGKLPTGMKSGTPEYESFIENAEVGYNKYISDKANTINKLNKNINVTFDPSSYSNLSATDKNKLTESISKISDFDSRMSELLKIFNEVGVEVIPTKKKAEMQGLRQQLILKGKELENLGVLNGPDMGILEDILPSTTGVGAIFSINENTKAKLEQLKKGYRNDATNKASMYGTNLTFKDGNASTSNTYNGFNLPK